MKIDQLSGRERGEENLAKVRRYLAGLREIGQSLPLQDGHANITAIAEASGVLRNVFYTNAGVKRSKTSRRLAAPDGIYAQGVEIADKQGLHW